MVYYACLAHISPSILVRQKCSVTMTFRLIPNLSIRIEYAPLWKCHDGILPGMTRTLPPVFSRRVFSRMQNLSIFSNFCRNENLLTQVV